MLELRRPTEAIAIALVLAAGACADPPTADPEAPAADPDPAAVRLAALTAAAAADALDDLQAVDNPDAAGVRDTFHSANRQALTAAREARVSAPEATALPFARSLEAAEAAGRFGDAFGLALEARADYAAAHEDAERTSEAVHLAQAEAEAARHLHVAETLAEAAQVREAQAHTAAEEAEEARESARRTLDYAMAVADQIADEQAQYIDAVDTWIKADREHRLARRLTAATAQEAAEAARAHSRAVGRRRALDRLPQREEELSNPQLVERLEAEARALAGLAAEAAAVEAGAGERAERAMMDAEARLDEAIAAYGAAVDAWRTLIRVEAGE